MSVLNEAQDLAAKLLKKLEGQLIEAEDIYAKMSEKEKQGWKGKECQAIIEKVRELYNRTEKIEIDLLT